MRSGGLRGRPQRRPRRRPAHAGARRFEDALLATNTRAEAALPADRTLAQLVDAHASRSPRRVTCCDRIDMQVQIAAEAAAEQGRAGAQAARRTRPRRCGRAGRDAARKAQGWRGSGGVAGGVSAS